MDDTSQREHLRKLQEIDFVLVELNLYLDTHPSDPQALEQFNHLSQKRRQMQKAYEAEFGPLYHFGLSCNRYPGGWNEGPWPWEL